MQAVSCPIPPVAADSNVKYLGRSGVASLGGLLVAFLDGQYNAAAYRAQELTGSSAAGEGCRYYAESGAAVRAMASFHFAVWWAAAG
jgi:hypothetical protein